MSEKGRLRVYSIGSHVLQPHLEDLLHKSGNILVDSEDNADMVLFGGNCIYAPSLITRKDVPVLLLSSYKLFTGVELHREVDEGEIAVVHPLAPFAEEVLNFLNWEHHFLRRGNTMVIRLFPTFGKDSPEDTIVSRLVTAANDSEPMYQLLYSNRVRSWLHMSDLDEGFERLLRAFLKGTTGIYNLGSTFQTRIGELNKSVFQLKGLDTSNPLDEEWWDMPWRPVYLVPDMTRTAAVTKWKPRVSLRAGLYT